MPLKYLVLYGVSGPSASKNFMLALSKNYAFYVALGSGGHWNWKNDMLKVFEHTSAKFVDMMGQHRANVGPTGANIGSTFGEQRANIGPTGANIGSI